MLLKIFRHEFKKLRSVSFILYGAMILLGVIIGVSSRELLRSLDSDSTSNGYLEMMTTMMIMVSMIALSVVLTVAEIFVIYRFYRAVSSDEAYLTFTLPVSMKEQFWARFLVMLAYSVLSSLALSVAVALFALIALPSDAIKELFEGMKTVIATIVQSGSAEAWLLIVEGIVCGIAYLLMRLAETMLAVLLGHSLSRKHKAGATIGVLIGMGYAQGIVLNVITIPFIVETPSLGTASVHLVLSVTAIACAALFAGSVVWSLRLMNKKLNLD